MFHWLLGNKDNPFHYTHHAVLLVGVIMYLSAGLFNLKFDTGDRNFSYFLIGIIAPLHLFIWYRSRFYNQFDTMAMLFILISGLFIIPLNWYFNAGSMGPSLVLSFIAITYMQALFYDKPHTKTTLFILFTLIMVILLLVEPLTQQWIYQYPNDTARLQDNLFSYVLAAWVCILIMNMMGKRYQLEKQKAEEYAEQLKILAERDYLTELYNRRAFAKIYSLAQKRHPQLCLAILDIDHFKLLNDQYGHEMGDQVLKIYAQGLLKMTNDEGQMVARHGGEEFLVLFPQPLKHAINQLNELNDYLNEHNIVDQPIQFSAGLVEVTQDEVLNDAIRRADQLLYQAKNTGRNAIVAQDTI